MKRAKDLFVVTSLVMVIYSLFTGCTQSKEEVYLPVITVSGPAAVTGWIDELVLVKYSLGDNKVLIHDPNPPLWLSFESSNREIVTDPISEETKVTLFHLSGETDLQPASFQELYGHLISSDDKTLEFDSEYSCPMLSKETELWVYYRCNKAGSAEVVVDLKGVEYSYNQGMQAVPKYIDADAQTTTITCIEKPPASCEGSDVDISSALVIGELLGFDESQICGLTDLTIEEIIHSAEEMASKLVADDHTTCDAYLANVKYYTQAYIDQLVNNSDFECGEGPNGLTLCPENITSVNEGDFNVIFNFLMDDMPLVDDTNTYQYGFVFDQDGNPSNNYIPVGTYSNDLFSGTDRWYEAVYSPSNGWSLKVTDATDGIFTPITDSQARIIIKDNVMVLLVPASEFSVEQPNFRVTAFRHTGDYGMNPPYNWDGSIWPSVADGLQSFSE
jgi:hypothetical protein